MAENPGPKFRRNFAETSRYKENWKESEPKFVKQIFAKGKKDKRT